MEGLFCLGLNNGLWLNFYSLSFVFDFLFLTPGFGSHLSFPIFLMGLSCSVFFTSIFERVVYWESLFAELTLFYDGALSWFLVPIELFSIIVRPFTLTVRLLVNFFRGHIIRDCLCYFSLSLGGRWFWSVWEVVVAMIQRVVYLLLFSVFVSEA